MNLLAIPKPFSIQPLQENFYYGISLFKDGLQYAGEKTADCIANIVLPINNFLKDIRDIDKEFDGAGKIKHDFNLCLDGKMVAAADVLKMDMEENY